MSYELVVWDFDGVLNDNMVDGRFVWIDDMERDLGLSLRRFSEHLFASGRMRSVITGREDLRDVLCPWLLAEGSACTPQDVLDYWFAKDALPDAQVVGWLTQSPARHVIGTNNEGHRAMFIEQHMGFGDLVERVFASGRMGVAKPDDGFFQAITDWADVPPERCLLIDDTAANVAAAQSLGWHGLVFDKTTRAQVPHLLGLATG